jgi:hypothetical protein
MRRIVHAQGLADQARGEGVQATLENPAMAVRFSKDVNCGSHFINSRRDAVMSRCHDDSPVAHG